ncbi:RNA-directed DNA polymerase [Zobellia uliginosa]|uniref:RNA-directed DNA polymerase n=1 Tax=Zobellia uliginosa TaxID=143224 RepID=A0ABY1KQV6_9FLAO|nr:reverse transcriptase family protein [Zobellia uliginosa]SIS46882.1 RNA-directed DNA polymerase [Zobellia uliginosa]
MTFEQYKIAFEKAASNSGYSELNIKRCLDYAKPLIENNVPIIYNTSHFSSLVGYKKAYIKKAVYYTKSFYTDYAIKKKNGKTRTISEPLPSLKEIQTWILQNIFQQLKVSPYAKAYKRKVSIVENLKFHYNQPKVFTLDLKDFFPSIKIHSVEQIFKSLGYSDLISNLLAKLCTKENCLPQGAPTSPYISNLYFLPADNHISEFCKQHSIRYTRYADDLTFSGNFDENAVLNFVSEQIVKLELVIHPDKIKLMTPNQRQSVTGIVVNQKPQVVFHKRNKVRQELYYIKKFGLANHMERKGIKKRNYLEHLLGKVNFIIQINPTDTEFIEYKEYLIKLKSEISGQT